MKEAQQAPTAVPERKVVHHKRSTPSRFKKKGLLKAQQSVIGVRTRTDKWVPAELNDR